MSLRYEHETAIFARNLRRIMREKNVTQTWLAAETGMTKSAVCCWCGAKREPTAIALKRISVALEVTTDDLLEGVK